MKLQRVNSVLLWVFPLLFFVFSYHFPFWGDGVASVSKAAVRIYQEGLHRPWNYPGSDPGHPTLFPWIIALCWKVFGFHLWVPHFLVAVQLYFLARIIRELAGPLTHLHSFFLLLIVFISPLTVSQSTGISLQMPLTLTFFAAYYFLQKEKRGMALLCMCLMMLVHLQAALLYAALVAFDFIKNIRDYKLYWKKLLLLTIPGWVFLAWGFFHYREFGWTFFTPNYERTPPGLKNMVYNLGISAWRFIDLGYFVITLPALYYLLVSFRKRTAGDMERLGLLTFLVLCIGIPVIFAYPPNHRYIFPVYLFSAVFFIRWLRHKGQRTFYAWMLPAIVLLCSGSFWYYPGKCQGDQNLVHLGYHRLEEEVAKDIGKAKVYSFAPLNNPALYTYLEESRTITYADLYNCSFDTLPLVLESNLNCEFTREQRKELDEKFWVQAYEGNALYVNLYLNKKDSSLYPSLAFNRPRQKSFLEEKMQELKAAFGK